MRVMDVRLMPVAGDIGDPVKWVEVEPVEVPVEVPQPETVPA